MDIGQIVPTFIAGVLTFLAPCTFPLLPAYLSIIGGGSVDEAVEEGNVKEYRRKVFLNGLFYVVGFSLVFIIMGVFAGSIGQVFPGFRVWFARVGGVITILFGLFMLGVFKWEALSRTYKIKLPDNLETGKPRSSFLIGASVAFGWTPCVGPILGSVLLLAANRATALEGGFLLAVFSAGLAVPFLGFALAVSSAKGVVRTLNRHTKTISRIGGVALILVGILLLFNRFDILIEYGYRYFDFEGLLQYL